MFPSTLLTLRRPARLVLRWHSCESGCVRPCLEFIHYYQFAAVQAMPTTKHIPPQEQQRIAAVQQSATDAALLKSATVIVCLLVVAALVAAVALRSRRRFKVAPEQRKAVRRVEPKLLGESRQFIV